VEVILLGIYSFFVWLIFFKFKWLPWNITSQVIVITLPIMGITALILFLNIVAPSSHDVRTLNYVVQVVPRVSGHVIEVPIEPNRPISKGDVLFKIDPTPYQRVVEALEAKVAQLAAGVTSASAFERELQEQLVTAQNKVKTAQARLPELQARVVGSNAGERELDEQLKAATSSRTAIASRLDLARRRVVQYRELVGTGAAPRFQLEESEAELASLEADAAGAEAAESQVRQKLSARTDDGRLADVAQSDAQLAQALTDLESARSSEAQVRQKLSARTDKGELAQVAEAKALLLAAEADLGKARWDLEQTVYKAPADGTVVDLQLRAGSYTVPMPLSPVMAFVEKEQWVLAMFRQNEVRYVQPGDEAEIALETHPGKIIKCKVDSVVWATAQGQLPMSGRIPGTGPTPIPEGRLAVRLVLDGKDKELFLAAGARGQGAIYTDNAKFLHIIRKVILRVGTKINWFVFKLH
jgi:multidrug resistance efflux pump